MPSFSPRAYPLNLAALSHIRERVSGDNMCSFRLGVIQRRKQDDVDAGDDDCFAVTVKQAPRGLVECECHERTGTSRIDRD